MATRLCLFGAPGINANLGLGALMQGTLAGVWAQRPDAEMTVFDDALGVRPSVFYGGDGVDHDYTCIGARYSRRVYRPESFVAMRISGRLKGLGNPGTSAVLAAHGVLDVSGGDSFSDIYGQLRFRRVSAPKLLALRLQRPLVLLPQTYGPFRSQTTADQARRLVLGARQAWARDDDSYEVLRDLLGPEFDPYRHRAGVDLAFLLPARMPSGLPRDVTDALADDPGPVGVNVSGLLWNHAERFDLTLDYRQSMTRVVSELAAAGHRVVLVPHVIGLSRNREFDNVAIEDLQAMLPSARASAVVSVPWVADAAHAKAIIARCSFFVGTRMHSTIAALSSGVPCTAVAYSPKYRGVFAIAGLPDAVLDARRLGSADLVEAVVTAVDRAPTWAKVLETTIEQVKARAAEQMSAILASVHPQR